MKKFLSIAAICAMAMVTMVSCGETKKPVTPTTPKVNVTVDKASIAPDAKATVTLTATAALTEAVDFTITTSDAAVATVSAEKVTIAKDAKSTTIEVTAVKDGKATIAVATNSTAVQMGTASVDITVKTGGTEPTEELVVCDASNPWSELWFAAESDGLGAGFTLWYNSQVLLENVGCDYVGADLALSAVEKGTEISSLEFKANSGHVLMGINNGDGYDQLPNFSNVSGTQYVVFCVMTDYVEPQYDADGVITNPQDFTHDKPQTKGWALVTSDNGAVTLHAYKFPADKVGE